MRDSSPAYDVLGHVTVPVDLGRPDVMTMTIELEPGSPGSGPHRHSGPVFMSDTEIDRVAREDRDAREDRGMRIFVAGGSGVIGSRLVPRLVAAGHAITATTRTEANLERLGALGARGVLLDVFDAEAVRTAVVAASPDVVMHMVTDLSDADLAANGRLRQVGTDHLVDAAKAAGVERMIAQSVAWVFPDGDEPATEGESIIPGSPVAHLEARVREIPHATILRFGMFYGPGTWYAPGGRMAQAVMAGAVSATPAISSFVHVDDAIAAVVQALDWPDGTVHIVDDEPAESAVWLPRYAEGLGAPAPRREQLPDGAPRGRAVSNGKARALGWVPGHPSWREGFPRL